MARERGSRQARATAKGLKEKQVADYEFRGLVIVGVVAWATAAVWLGTPGFWGGMVVFVLLLIGGVADWMRE